MYTGLATSGTTSSANEWLWERLHWDESDWSDQTRAVLDDTVDALVISSEGEQLQVISRLVDLIDQDIYSAGDDSVNLPDHASVAAEAACWGLAENGTPDEALRAAIGASTTLDEVIEGLAQVVLAWNNAYESVKG